MASSNLKKEKKEKKVNPLYKRIIKLFSSRTARNIIMIIVLVFSVFCMLMLDKGNYVLNKYMPFLNTNFIKSFMAHFNIKSFNVTVSAWLIFLCIMGVLILFMFAGIFAPKIVTSIAKAKRDSFKTELGARRFYAFWYYFIVLLIAGAIIFMCAMSGAFKNFKEYNAGLFLNLLYTVLLSLMFALIAIIALLVVYYVIKFVLWFLVTVTKKLNEFAKEVKDEEEQRKKEEPANYTGNALPTSLEEEEDLGRDLFPALTAIDNRYTSTVEQTPAVEVVAEQTMEETPVEETTEEVPVEDITLSDFVLRFQSHAINHYKVYYELPLLRSFIAGLSATRLIILEGLSGTGKSLLPRMFSRFTGSTARFSPVQATWRDKTDVLGFFSEFTKTFKITDFLCYMYEASYAEETTLMVLDEMNLSRIEYYFADFLSVLEYPKEEWKIKVYEPELGQKLPKKLTGGYVTIPANTWFIGTANTDDSTFTITDKVYDRAITLDFRERISPITSDYSADPIHITSEKLQQLFTEAQENEELRLNKEETDKFLLICDFMRDVFDIRFGNRIMVQINQFVPVYVALGGSKEEALDFMFSSKVMRKLNGMFEDYVKDELVTLQKLLADTYGKGVFVETERIIAKILKRLV